MFYLFTILVFIFFTTVSCNNYNRYDQYNDRNRNGGDSNSRYENNDYYNKMNRPVDGYRNTDDYNRYASTSGSSVYNSGGGYGYNTGGYNTNDGYNTGGLNTGNYNSRNGYNTGGVYNPYQYGGGTYGGFKENDYCRNRSAQGDIMMDRLMGMWYGVEVISHLSGDPGVERSPSCVVVHIAEIFDEPSTSGLEPYHEQQFQYKYFKEYRRLKLLWDEAGKDIEYSLYFRNESQGIWHTESGQNGSLILNAQYSQFSGAVQVLKAVENHILLNFCEENPPQLFSVLLSREPKQLHRRDIDSIHQLLRLRNLSVSTRRLVCGNSGSSLKSFSILLVTLTIFVKSSF